MIHENCGNWELATSETDCCEGHGEGIGKQESEYGEMHCGAGHGMPHGSAGCGCMVGRGFPDRGWIQLLILRVLYEKSTYGYQLLEEIEKRSEGYHKLMPGSIYTILRRMEHRGLLRSEWEKVESGPDRRMYKLTDEGVAVLRTGLEAIVKRRKLTDDLVKFYEQEFKGEVSRTE